MLGTTDEDGELTHLSSYRPYGRKRGGQARDPFNLDTPLLGFQGNPQDAETGNGYNETRYNEGDGTWTTRDSVPTMNQMAAHDGDPVNNRDDNGELAHPIGLLTALPGMIGAGADLAQADSAEEVARAGLGFAANFSTVAGALETAMGDATDDEDTAAAEAVLGEDTEDGVPPDTLEGGDSQSDDDDSSGLYTLIGIAGAILATVVGVLIYRRCTRGQRIQERNEIDVMAKNAVSPDVPLDQRKHDMDELREFASGYASRQYAALPDKNLLIWQNARKSMVNRNNNANQPLMPFTKAQKLVQMSQQNLEHLSRLPAHINRADLHPEDRETLSKAANYLEHITKSRR